MQFYEHGGDIYRNKVTLDFSVNTNPYGMPPEVKSALVSSVDACALYPDPRCEALCGKIAGYEGVAEQNVLCGNGAADLIYRLVFSQKPDKALVCAPTFSEYERAVLHSGGTVEYHTLQKSDGFRLTGRILDDITPEIDMVFICNPNNPTGKLAEHSLLQAIADKCAEVRALLVVDECFLPFTNGVSLKERGDAVIIKAFTKIYSMAGLRLGYMLCKNEQVLHKARDLAQIWSVSVPAQTAGLQALDCAGWVRDCVLRITAERERMTGELRALGLTVWDGDANFLLFESGVPLYEPLLRQGILIRACDNFRGLNERFGRLAVKTREENDTLISAVKTIIGGNTGTRLTFS